MKTSKSFLLFTALILMAAPIFSQAKKVDFDYQQKMGKALDELSSWQMEEVLEYAAQLVQKENTRKALSCIANSLSVEDQAKLLEQVELKKYAAPSVTAAPAYIPEVPVGPLTTMEFEEESFDFGVINQGDKVAHVYKFTNTGTEPLLIATAKGSCGCTVPKFPREPIAPGETAELSVEFDSKGKRGKQNKRVTITANTSPAQYFILIEGDVIPKEE